MIPIQKGESSAPEENPRAIAEFHAREATHYNPYTDAFPPQRNRWLLEAKAKMAGYEGGVELLIEELGRRLNDVRREMEESRVAIGKDFYGWDLRWSPALEKQIEINLPPEIQRRALWWNDRASSILKSDGIDGLINDPSLVCLALGNGHWLDAGNLMVEPRFVGSSLSYMARPDLNLYRDFGVEGDTFTFFPHMKHKPGLFQEPYSHLLFGQNVTLEVLLSSYELILEFMRANPPSYSWQRTDLLVIPGTWFHDPGLPEIDPRFSWVSETAEKIVVIGEADVMAPLQTQFAIAQSGKRRKLYEEGKYKPQIAAAIISFKFMEQLLETKGHPSSVVPSNR